MSATTHWSACASWWNPPAAQVLGADGVLTATSLPETDFWQETFYGFHPDSGHALLTPAPAEFTATLTFDGEYRTLYDQAGLMLRAGPARWIKFGVEWSDGAAQLSVVVTDGRSDWSTRPLVLAGPVTLRATRLAGAVFLQWQGPAGWEMARLAPFAAEAALSAGPYLCSPQRGGFVARFLDFRVTEPAVRQLHAD